MLRLAGMVVALLGATLLVAQPDGTLVFEGGPSLEVVSFGFGRPDEFELSEGADMSGFNIGMPPNARVLAVRARASETECMALHAARAEEQRFERVRLSFKGSDEELQAVVLSNARVMRVRCGTPAIVRLRGDKLEVEKE